MGKPIIAIAPAGREESRLPLPLRKIRSLKRRTPAATAALVAAAIANESEAPRADP
jgi:hypothetical protein